METRSKRKIDATAAIMEQQRGFFSLLSLLFSLAIITVLIFVLSSKTGVMPGSPSQEVIEGLPFDSSNPVAIKQYALDIARQADMKSIQTQLEIFFAEQNRYPDTLEELAAQEYNGPGNPPSISAFTYEVERETFSYKLCIKEGPCIGPPKLPLPMEFQEDL